LRSVVVCEARRAWISSLPRRTYESRDERKAEHRSWKGAKARSNECVSRTEGVGGMNECEEEADEDGWPEREADRTCDMGCVDRGDKADEDGDDLSGTGRDWVLEASSCNLGVDVRLNVD
jgi:hypothetical protein